MEILLHIGAHRTATTTFQSYLWDNRAALARGGVTAWTPRRTRDGLMAGMTRHPALITLRDEERAQRSMGRVRMESDRLARCGQRSLLISDENMSGTAMNNIADARLYPLLAERVRRFAETFAGRPLRIGLAIRSYDDYWASVLAYAVERGRGFPDADLLDWLVTQPRRWRSMVRDLAKIMAGAEILVWPFETFAHRPGAVLAALLGRPAPAGLEQADRWQNRSASAAALAEIAALRGEAPPVLPLQDATRRWMPFDTEQQAVLRAEYRRDLAWLRAGAEGLATFIDGRQTPAPRPDGKSKSCLAPPGAWPTRGQADGIEESRLG